MLGPRQKDVGTTDAAAFPYCEDGHALLIRVYEALGDTTRATAAYDRYQRLVRHELAAEPRPALVLRFEGQTSARSALPAGGLRATEGRDPPHRGLGRW
jgi:DNA-binding SARP family transcriptional activator